MLNLSRPIHRCPDCGRPPAECWNMPCLGLEIAMSKGFRAMQQWSKACGTVIRNAEALKAEIADRRARLS